MRRFYVDISGISEKDLELLGYFREYAEAEFILYVKKGEDFIVHRTGEKKCLFVDDLNDALILRGRLALAAPPANI